MFEHLMKENNMRTFFLDYGLNETHIEIIKVQIGPRAGDRTADDNHKRVRTLSVLLLHSL